MGELSKLVPDRLAYWNPSPDDTKEQRDHRDDSACGRDQDGGLEEGKG